MGLLAKYEADIENYELSYQKAGLALLGIKDAELWIEGYQSFEDYCWTRWGFKKSRCSQLLASASFLLTLEGSTSGKPPNERVAREFLSIKVWEKVNGRYTVDELKTEQKRIDTWEMVSSHFNGETMTAEDTRAMIDKSIGRGVKDGPSLEKRKKTALSRLSSAMDVFIKIRWTPKEKKQYAAQIRERIRGW